MIQSGRLRKSFTNGILVFSAPIKPHREEGYRGKDRKPYKYIFKTPKEIKIIKRCEKILGKHLGVTV